MVYNCKRKYASRDAFRVKTAVGGICGTSYTALSDDMDAFGTALFNIGLKGEHIAIIGENCYEWVVSYLAVVNGGSVIVPIDKELSEEEIANVILKSDSSVVIYTQSFASVIQSLQPQIISVKYCIGIHEASEHGLFLSYDRLINWGKELLTQGDNHYVTEAVDPEKMCVILYTSGTTGNSKGVMLCQKNLVSVIYGAMQAIRLKRVTLSVLPIHHTYENTCGILTTLYDGITICFNDSLKYLTENIQLFKPSMLILVPLFVEAMYKKIWEKAKKTGRETLLKKLIAISNALLKVHIDFRALFFHSIRKAFGGKLKLIICGGAPLRAELVYGFNELGIQVLNGYGITECSPLVSVNRNRYYCEDSVGVVIPCCEVRIDSPDENKEGEILVRGDNVMMGYYKNAEETKKAFDGEWFRTGDIGMIGSDGFLRITGRIKNTIILSNGKNIQPEELEDHLINKLPYIKEVIVFGLEDETGKKTSVCARVVLDNEYAEEKNIDNLEAVLSADIHEINRNLPTYKQINKVMTQYEEFEKTTSKKIKRYKFTEEG